MNQTVLPGSRSGTAVAPASKSQAHRYLICAALGSEKTDIKCRGISKDIAATAACLNAAGAEIVFDGETIKVTPVKNGDGARRVLPCGESGSTLRFMMAVAGALGLSADFKMEGRLKDRPLAPYDDELRRHGMEIEPEGDILHCGGALKPGKYTIPGNVSSQYISGLLMALPLLKGGSTLEITDNIESLDYITMTEQALGKAGILFEKAGPIYKIPGNQRYEMPGKLEVEGDYSNGAFFLCAGALSKKGVTVTGLDSASKQGDRRIAEILKSFGAKVEISENAVSVCGGNLHGMIVDAAMIPDLIPVLSVVAAAAEGETEIVNAGRLRLKESDRLKTTAEMLSALGADVRETENGLIIRGGKPLKGGGVNPENDHRIAMAAAVAAGICSENVTIEDAQCVQKSYPGFWNEFSDLEVN